MTDRSLKPEFKRANSDPAYEACRKLWASCLLHLTKDFLFPSDRHRKKNPLPYVQARSWFGPFPGRDFSEVCMNAGFDPDEFHRRVLMLHDKPESERLAISRRMIAKAGA